MKIIADKMPDSFFEWLHDCPVEWFLFDQTKAHLTYNFVVPDEEEETEKVEENLQYRRNTKLEEK